MGQKETCATILELEKVKIISPAQMTLDRPVWPGWKLDGVWKMAIDYLELNQVTPTICAAIANIAQILETLTTWLGTCHAMMGLVNAFFSMPTDKHSQDIGRTAVGLLRPSPRIST